MRVEWCSDVATMYIFYCFILFPTLPILRIWKFENEAQPFPHNSVYAAAAADR